MDKLNPNIEIYKVSSILCSVILIIAGVGALFIHAYFITVLACMYNVVKVYLYLKKPSGFKPSSIINDCTFIALIMLNGYHNFSEYKISLWQDKFGIEFNKKRAELGIPIIPTGWNAKLRSPRSVDWLDKEDAIGHKDKYLSFDTCRRITFEDDEYNLKPINGIARDVLIRTKYGRGNSKDSIFYYYEVGDSSHTILKYLADSIFDIEKIKKDY